MCLIMTEKQHFPLIRRLIYVGLILFVAYVLSVGPVCAMYVSGKNDQAVYEKFISFYTPIVWADQNTPLNQIIGPYIMFWERIFGVR